MPKSIKSTKERAKFSDSLSRRKSSSANRIAAPIGVFDSGIGGLTVVRRLSELCPNERIVYFGDIARLPYGTKSGEMIRRYAREDVEFLLRFKPKLIIAACNTISALALDVVNEVASPVPVLGVIGPGAAESLRHSRSLRIGVIGTAATIASQAYVHAIQALNPSALVFSQPCPLFVPMVEEGFFDHAATELIAHQYLDPLKKQKIDTLVLGCTHYPLLKPLLQRILPKINIIDSAFAVAKSGHAILEAMQCLNPRPSVNQSGFYVSDLPEQFKSSAEAFLGWKLPHIEKVQITP